MAINKPDKNPVAVPMSSPKIIAAHIGIPWVTIKPTVKVPVIATIFPTERSMPPRIITNDIPIAIYILMEICLKTDKILFAVKNLSVRNVNKIHKKSRTTNMPVLFFNVANIPRFFTFMIILLFIIILLPHIS